MIAAVTGAAVISRSRGAAGGIWRTLAPGLEREIAERFPRFGRFDEYTQIGCAAVFAAARQAGFQSGGPRRPVGLILAGQYGSFETDEAFYATTLSGPELASPNLFSYTLPNIVLGECAAQFGWMGPAYVLDDEGGRGRAALTEAAAELAGGRAEAMLAGWLETRPAWAPPGPEGAAVVVLEPAAAGRPSLLTLDLPAAAGTIDDILLALGLPAWTVSCPGSRECP